jgi:RNA polymerase sigma-70 factor (ECF subfamily)
MGAAQKASDGVASNTMQDIPEVVHRCQQGQLDAFATLFNHYQNRIYDLACAILRDDAGAEDVVQDAFLAVFQKIDSYKGDSAFDTWLTAIVVNQCRMRLRKRKIRQALSLEQLSPRRLFHLAGRSDGIPSLVHNRQRRRDLWEMVDELDDRLRLPLILRYRYALPCNEIAAILDHRKATIYQQLNEGRRCLEQMAARQEIGSQATLVKVK